MYLLDTNICIYIINKSPSSIVEIIKNLKPHQIKLSSISLAELQYGISKSINRKQNKKALLDFVSCFDIIEFDDIDAEVYGIIRADLEKRGQVIGPYDMLIAAQAISRELILVTNNTKEFLRIKNISIENWLK